MTSLKSRDAVSLLQQYPDWYSASDEPEELTFGPVHGLSITGQGEPGGTAHTEAIQILFVVTQELVAHAAKAGTPFSVPPLEGRWWIEDKRPWFEVPRDQWRWHLFLRVLDALPAELVDQAREAARATRDRFGAARVQLVTFTEGQSVQAMHRGPYADEPKTLAKIDALMERNGLIPNGLHHEIYLSDIRETDPSKIRAILRQPVRRPVEPAR
jgi:hypothetical protein